MNQEPYCLLIATPSDLDGGPSEIDFSRNDVERACNSLPGLVSAQFVKVEVSDCTVVLEYAGEIA